MFCIHCGSKRSLADKFCNGCGRPNPVASPEAVLQGSPSATPVAAVPTQSPTPAPVAPPVIVATPIPVVAPVPVAEPVPLPAPVLEAALAPAVIAAAPQSAPTPAPTPAPVAIEAPAAVPSIGALPAASLAIPVATALVTQAVPASSVPAMVPASEPAPVLYAPTPAVLNSEAFTPVLRALEQGSGLMANTVIFLVAYMACMVPTYALPYFGSNSFAGNAVVGALTGRLNPALFLHIAFLAALIGIAACRAAHINKPVVLALACVAAGFDLVPFLSMIPLVPTVMHVLVIVFGANAVADPSYRPTFHRAGWSMGVVAACLVAAILSAFTTGNRFKGRVTAPMIQQTVSYAVPQSTSEFS